MNGLEITSPWPLFTDDLGLARAWAKDQLRRRPFSIKAGHQALNLGLHDIISARMFALAGPGDAAACRRQWGFCLARIQGECNPYGHLIPPALRQATAAALQASLQRGDPLWLQLSGGIGDRLETLGLVVPWARSWSVELRLLVDAGGRALFRELVPPGVALVDAHPSVTSPVSQGMAVRQAILAHSPETVFDSFLAPVSQAWLQHSGLLCCWKAEGRGNAFSAHSRSVPFALVRQFYGQLLCQCPRIEIVDITTWRPWERDALASLGVRCVDPCAGGLLNLAREACGRRVITIDTALAHLCAACALPADLLLPRFHDERWFELHRPQHSYGRWLRVWRSPDFGSWSAVLPSLHRSIASDLGCAGALE